MTRDSREKSPIAQGQHDSARSDEELPGPPTSERMYRGMTKPLTPEEERYLLIVCFVGRRMAEILERASLVKEAEPFRRIVREACDEIVFGNIEFVVREAKRYYYRVLKADRTDWVMLDDLLQLVFMGLRKAIFHFDPTKGDDLRAFAHFPIRNSVLRSPEVNRVPNQELQRDYRALRAGRAEFNRKHGCEPTIDELTAETGLDRNRIAAVRDAYQFAFPDGFEMPHQDSDEAPEIEPAAPEQEIFTFAHVGVDTPAWLRERFALSKDEAVAYCLEIWKEVVPKAERAPIDPIWLADALKYKVRPRVGQVMTEEVRRERAESKHRKDLERARAKIALSLAKDRECLSDDERVIVNYTYAWNDRMEGHFTKKPSDEMLVLHLSLVADQEALGYCRRLTRSGQAEFAASLLNRKSSVEKETWRGFIDSARGAGLRVGLRSKSEPDAADLGALLAADQEREAVDQEHEAADKKRVVADPRLAQQALRLWLHCYADLRRDSLQNLVDGQSLTEGDLRPQDIVTQPHLRLEDLTVSPAFARQYPSHSPLNTLFLAGMLPFLSAGIARRRTRIQQILAIEFQAWAADADHGEPLPDTISREFLQGWIGENKDWIGENKDWIGENK